jgi:transposase
MSRILTIRKPGRTEARQLQELLEASDHPGIRRRAEAVLLYGVGFSATEIAEVLDVHPNTIYADLQAFARDGLTGVEALSTAGLPPSLTEAQKAEIRRLANQSPVELGLPWGRWSLAKLCDYLIKHRVLKTISREHLRRVLKKGRYAFAGSRKSSSARILAAGRFWPVFAGFGSICLPGACCCSLM